jgi:uncharacterized membrane protein
MTIRRDISPVALLLARTLSYGTWISASVIFIGLTMNFAASRLALQAESGTRVASAGIALLILLPALRVVLMLGEFIRKREYRLAVFATTVLIVIGACLALGMRVHAN